LPANQTAVQKNCASTIMGKVRLMPGLYFITVDE
jgi:hypothetical protein